MEYIDGGGWYLSNIGLKSVLAACALNPVGTTLFVLGYWKVVSLLSAKWALFLGKLGSVGGFIGSAAGFALGALTAGSVATTIAAALWAGKGIEFGFTWRPTLEVR
ncbi:hypothetical protein [Clostridium tertium]|uniref:hypothetical protein n=1 Tax=Clostridium tertium TaxID=1559 RepID=UPI00374E6D87